MNESQINLDLYHKMREEQDEYRSWLLSQTPKEILNHANEYSVRGNHVRRPSASHARQSSHKLRTPPCKCVC